MSLFGFSNEAGSVPADGSEQGPENVRFTVEYALRGTDYNPLINTLIAAEFGVYQFNLRLPFIATRSGAQNVALNLLWNGQPMGGDRFSGIKYAGDAFSLSAQVTTELEAGDAVTYQVQNMGDYPIDIFPGGMFSGQHVVSP